MRTTIFALIVTMFIMPVVGKAKSAGKKQTDMCNVIGLIDTMLKKDGPLKGCNLGDVVHFQVAPERVSYSSVVARYCNLDSAVIVEKHPTKPLGPVHVVCKYEWHWAREVKRAPHPDHRK